MESGSLIAQRTNPYSGGVQQDTRRGEGVSKSSKQRSDDNTISGKGAIDVHSIINAQDTCHNAAASKTKA
eukprot:3425886-Amphidinium_carterae.2